MTFCQATQTKIRPRQWWLCWQPGEGVGGVNAAQPPHTAGISPSCFSLGGRRGVQYQYNNDKENIPQEEDDEDGPILYRDEDEMEDEGERTSAENLGVLLCDIFTFFNINIIYGTILM